MADHVVTLNDELKRFETVVDGHTAFLEYALANDRLVLIHTEVPAEIEGQGVGTAIVEAALDLDEHPEAAERITLAES